MSTANIGNSPSPSGYPTAETLNALPWFSGKHRAIVVEAVNPNKPCPAKRKPTIPTKSMGAFTVMLTIPNQLGVDYNLHILESFATHVAPALGWRPNTEGPVLGTPA